MNLGGLLKNDILLDAGDFLTGIARLMRSYIAVSFNFFGLVIAALVLSILTSSSIVGGRGSAAVACPTQSDNDFVLVAFGQSNSTNYGGITWSDPFWGNDQYSSKGEVHVLDWRSGECFMASDPLPGGDGMGGGPSGAVWGMF